MRRLFDGESSKRAQLHDSGEVGIDLLQAIERTIKCEDGDLARPGDLCRIIERDGPDALAPFSSGMTTGVVDQDSAHHLCGHTEEVRSTPPIDTALIDQPQVSLVDQRGRLQRVSGSLAPKLARRDAAELRIDEWQQLIECTVVAATPITEQRRDAAGRGHQPSSAFMTDRGFVDLQDTAPATRIASLPPFD
jgi:hypothetical protein